jgi:hypothetical protein
MNIINEANAFLARTISLYADISLDVFLGEKSEELMARNDPSRAVEARYLDGSRVGTFNFSYYAKSMDSEKARQQLDAIVSALDFKSFASISGVTKLRMEAATTPAFVTKTEAGEVVFVASLQIEYHTGG